MVSTKLPADRLEDFLDGLGYPGRYQLLVYVLLSFNFILLCFAEYSNYFFSRVPEHRCRLDPRFSSTLANYDDSYPVEMKDSAKVFARCVMWKNPANRSSGLQMCQHGWEYHVEETNEWTVASEWNLVCDEGYLLKLVPTLQTTSSLLGAAVFGSVADKYGRRPVLLFTLFFVCGIGGSLYFVHKFLFYLSLKCVQGLLGSGLHIASYVLSMEYLPSGYRPYAALGIRMMWSCSAICLAITNYFIKHWRYVQLSITVPFAVTVMYIWLIPESLIWLITEGKTEISKCTTKRILRYNKLAIPENISTEIKKIQKAQRELRRRKKRVSHNICDLFRTTQIRKRTLILFCVWFTSSVTYSLLSESVPSLTQSFHVDFIISVVVEAGTTVIIFLLVARIGCRIPTCSCFAILGMIGIVSAVMPKVIQNTFFLTQTISFICLIGKTVAVTTMAIAELYSVELLPTTLRCMGFGFCMLWSRLGILLGPQLFNLKMHTSAALPFVCVGGLCILCSVLTAFLPSTKLSTLACNVEDIDPVDKNSRRQTCGAYSFDGSYSSRAQDIIRNDAVIKQSPATSDVETKSDKISAKSLRNVGAVDDNICSSNRQPTCNGNENSDSDEGGFTTFGKKYRWNGHAGRSNSDVNGDAVTKDNIMGTFVKQNPLILANEPGEDEADDFRGYDNGALSMLEVEDVLHPSQPIQYSAQVYFGSKDLQFRNLDTAVL